MTSLALLPSLERLARSPELASLSILEAALPSCENALLAAHPEVAHGALDECERGSSAMRAHAILVGAAPLECEDAAMG